MEFESRATTFNQVTGVEVKKVQQLLGLLRPTLFICFELIEHGTASRLFFVTFPTVFIPWLRSLVKNLIVCGLIKQTVGKKGEFQYTFRFLVQIYFIVVIE